MCWDVSKVVPRTWVQLNVEILVISPVVWSLRKPKVRHSQPADRGDQYPESWRVDDVDFNPDLKVWESGIPRASYQYPSASGEGGGALSFVSLLLYSGHLGKRTTYFIHPTHSTANPFWKRRNKFTQKHPGPIKSVHKNSPYKRRMAADRGCTSIILDAYNQITHIDPHHSNSKL